MAQACGSAGCARMKVSTYTHQPQPGYRGKEPQVCGTGGLPGGKGTTGSGQTRAQGQNEAAVSPMTSGPLCDDLRQLTSLRISFPTSIQ